MKTFLFSSDGMPKRKFGRRWRKRRARKRGLPHWAKGRKATSWAPKIPKYTKAGKRLRRGL